jgi:uncharacterized protein YbbK (DUF523 family)
VKIVVSACLLGERVRYDGASKPNPKVAAALAGAEVVPICPEVMGGLPVPRPAVCLYGGDGAAVLAGHATCRELERGIDRTEAFRRGAAAALAAAEGATHAILKERSPSCGCQQTWVDGAVVPGRGVAAAALMAAGLVVRSDEQL